MSGPKISKAQIEAELRRRMTEQRARNASIIKRALGDIRSVSSQVANGTACLGRYQGEALAKVMAVEQRYVVLASSSLSAGFPASPDAAAAFNDRAEAAARSLLADLRSEMRGLEDSWQRDATGAIAVAELDSFDEELRGMDSLPAGSLDLDGMLEAIGQEQSECRFLAQAERRMHEETLGNARMCVAEMRRLIVSPHVTPARRVSLAGIASNLSRVIGEYQTKRDIAPLRSAVTACSASLISVRRQHEAARDLYEECLIEAKQIEALSGLHVDVPSVSQAGGTERLRQRLAELREECTRMAESAYVSHAIDAVMAKRGYSLKQSVLLVDLPAIPHDLHVSRETGEGIHTFVSPSGTIMMETGSCEGMPARQDVTMARRDVPSDAGDRQVLLRQQERFCELFPGIVDDLREMGVTLSPLVMNPPSEETSVCFSAGEEGAGSATGAKRESDDGRRRRMRQAHATGREREQR